MQSTPPPLPRCQRNRLPPCRRITLTVRGLRPARTYRLLRGVELPDFSTEVLRKQPAGETDVFTDPNPPSPRAFYVVEQL